MLPSAEALGVDTRSDDSCARPATGSEASNTSHWCTAHNYNHASEHLTDTTQIRQQTKITTRCEWAKMVMRSSEILRIEEVVLELGETMIAVSGIMMRQQNSGIRSFRYYDVSAFQLLFSNKVTALLLVALHIYSFRCVGKDRMLFNY